jgi:hypothetical protein
MRYDLYYIKNRSLSLDMRIMFETVGTILFGKGAAEVSHRRAPLRPQVAWVPRARITERGPYIQWLPGSSPAPVRHSSGQP